MWNDKIRESLVTDVMNKRVWSGRLVDCSQRELCKWGMCMSYPTLTAVSDMAGQAKSRAPANEYENVVKKSVWLIPIFAPFLPTRTASPGTRFRPYLTRLSVRILFASVLFWFLQAECAGTVMFGDTHNLREFACFLFLSQYDFCSHPSFPLSFPKATFFFLSLSCPDFLTLLYHFWFPGRVCRHGHVLGDMHKLRVVTVRIRVCVHAHQPGKPIIGQSAQPPIIDRPWTDSLLCDRISSQFFSYEIGIFGQWSVKAFVFE